MSIKGEDTYNLSFLAPTRGPLQPTVLDLERYFPGRLYWKWTAMEKYTIGEEELEELRSTGWETIDYKAMPSVFLRLTSQLNLVLALATPEKQELTFWIRNQDLRHAEQYPVMLVYEATQEIPIKELQRMIIGTQAIISEGDAIYRYELSQLGEAGQEQAHIIATGMQYISQPFLTDHNRNLSAQKKAKASHDSLARYFSQSQMAALRLSELYWQLHIQRATQPVRLPHTIMDIPPAFRHANLYQKNGNLIPVTDGLEAAIRAMTDAHDGAKGWGDPKKVPMYVHERETSMTAVTVRMNQSLPDTETNAVAKQLWERVTTYSDNDGDILLAMLAQVVAAGPDSRGGTWITAQAVLDYRGILPKRHEIEPGMYRDAGHRPEDMRQIAESVERLRDMHVSVRTWREPRKPGGRRRKVTQESYLILISDFLLQTEEGRTQDNPLQIAWYYRPGDCLNVPLRQNTKVAWLLQQALRYDPYHEKWEKRLARYFMFQLRINSAFGGTTIQRSIRNILQEAGLSSSIDYTNPDRTRVRFEKAMRTLHDHGHISDWSEAAYIVAVQQRSTRGWLEQWLSQQLEITAAPLLEDLAHDMLDQIQAQQQLAGPKKQAKRSSRKKGGEQEQ